MQNHLNSVRIWSESNLMKINWKKTKEMIIAQGKFKESYLTLEYNGSTIEQVSSFKLLRVSVNTALRWNDHIDTIKAKAFKRLCFLPSESLIRSSSTIL